MQVNLECMSGEPLAPRYAFYDKGKDGRNDGWVWFHRDLSIDGIRKFYVDHFRNYFGNGVLDGKGFVCYGESLVLYQYFPGGKDDKGRDHWVLLLAWLPAKCQTSYALSILENDVFMHVRSNRDTWPPQLCEFDYQSELIKLMYEGAKVDIDSHVKGREYIRKINDRGAVNVSFYWEKPNGSATIETQKKSSLQG